MALWTEAEEDAAWDESGPVGVSRLALGRYVDEVERLRARLRDALDGHCGCLSDHWCEDDDQPMNDCVWPTARCFQPADA